jgi:hypothetical protein
MQPIGVDDGRKSDATKNSSVLNHFGAAGDQPELPAPTGVAAYRIEEMEP